LTRFLHRDSFSGAVVLKLSANNQKGNDAMPDQPQQPPLPPEKKQTKAIPGKPVEGAELRKETVRINLPPKLGQAARPTPPPSPTVQLPRQETVAAAPAGTPTVPKIEQPAAKTAVLKVAAPPAEAPKKSDTAQVLPRPGTQAAVPAVEPPKPTVKLPRAEPTSATTILPPPAPKLPPLTMPTTELPAPLAEMAAVPAEGNKLEGVLALVTAVLSILVLVVLLLAK
jgi:hypothetical protein